MAGRKTRHCPCTPLKAAGAYAARLTGARTVSGVTILIDIRRATDRFVTRTDWLESYHSFSFNNHYHHNNVSHGLLMVNNDDIVTPRAGFGTHHHSDMEIVTWVLSGTLEHRDSAGNHGMLYPGLAQRMSAGTGIEHSEFNPNHNEAVRFIQMWITPDTTGSVPSYEQLDMNSHLHQGVLVPVASGRGLDDCISLGQRDATLWVARLQGQETVIVPDCEYGHLFVCNGSVRLASGNTLLHGDTARLTAASKFAFTALEPTEVLFWEMHSRPA